MGSSYQKVTNVGLPGSVPFLITVALFILIGNIGMVKRVVHSSFGSGTLALKRSSRGEGNIDEPWVPTMNASGTPLCSRDQLRDGYWVRKETEKPPYWPTKGLQETIECYGKEWRKISPWISHDWQPRDTSCHFGSWNLSDFCTLLKGKTLGIIGDSISQESYMALVFRLERQTSPLEVGNLKQGRGELVVTVPCGFRAYFKRDNYLEAFPGNLNTTDIDVLLMNRGSHYVTDEELLQDMHKLVISLVKFQRQRWSEGKDFRFIWRTTPPGHPHATQFTEPVNNITFMEDHVNNFTFYNNTKRRHFNWYQFKRQNQLVLKLLDESDLTYDIIDGYELMIRRPDLHMKWGEDGLHSCKPGKTDVYSTLMLHILQQEPYHRSRYWIDEAPNSTFGYLSPSKSIKQSSFS